MSWITDATSFLQGDAGGASSSPAGATLNGSSANMSPVSLAAIAPFTKSAAGDSLRSLADRLLGTNNVVDQVYGAASTAAAPSSSAARAGAAPGQAAGPAWMHYAPIIAVAAVALFLALHGRMK